MSEAFNYRGSTTIANSYILQWYDEFRTQTKDFRKQTVPRRTSAITDLLRAFIIVFDGKEVNRKLMLRRGLSLP